MAKALKPEALWGVSVLRAVVEQACRERDKVKADLDLADQRNLKLVREVDDRHASMETLNQSRIRSDLRFTRCIKCFTAIQSCSYV